MFQQAWCNGTTRERSIPEDRPPLVTETPPEISQVVADELVAAKSIPAKQGVIARETANVELHKRTVFPQVSLNPFLKQSDYVRDLGVQDRFLRPQSSHEPEQENQTTEKTFKR